MALTTYEELKSSIADYLNRSDLTSVIPDFVTLCDADMNRTLRTREMTLRTRAALNGQYLKLPPDFLGMRNIELITDPITPLQYLNMQNMDLHRVSNATGKPIYYSIMQNNLEFAPVPDSSTEYTLEIVYYRKIEALSSINATNHILDSHPDAYLMGSLMQSAPYLVQDERIPIWSGRYEQIKEQIKTSDENAKFSGSTPNITFNPF